MHSNRSIPSHSVDSVQIRVSHLSRQSAQSTVHTAIPGDPVSYGENTHMVPRYLLAMGKILKWYPEILLARYSGTMHHHAKDFLWPRGRRDGCCCYSASQQQYDQYELVQLSATVSRYRAVGPS